MSWATPGSLWKSETNSLDVRSLSGKWMLTHRCSSTSKLGGRTIFRVWRSGGVQPKVLMNKRQRPRTRRESEKCRFQDGL
jgi:hypothetical protein